jgi:hypothetical protein
MDSLFNIHPTLFSRTLRAVVLLLVVGHVLAFLTINAFAFLVPMMPEMVELARESLPSGEVTQAFLDKAATEQLVGMSSVISLILELVLGSFQPKLFGERRH